MRNKNIFLLLAVSVILPFCAATPVTFNSQLPVFEKISFSESPAYQVLRITAGDTIIIDVNNQDMKIKLVGVKPAEKYSAEMTTFVKNLLTGENVYIVADADRNEPGRYDYYVYRVPDGLFVNAEIIRQGYGLAETIAPFKYMPQFKQLAEFAKERDKGLWHTAQLQNVSQPVVTVSSKNLTQKEDVTVYVTKTGKKYHSAGCMFLSKSSIPIKLSEAKARGFAPCGKCNPP